MAKGIVVVGTRNNQRVIHWPGVLQVSLIIGSISGAGAAVMSFLLTQALNPDYIITAVCLTSLILVGGIGQAWTLPPDKLTRLD